MAGSIVYYIRRGQAIKIGSTTNPMTRFTVLMPDEILAFEPGATTEERKRHRQFQHLRCFGEHFKPDPELLEHALDLRRIHGDPDPAWPTVAILERAPVSPKRPAKPSKTRRPAQKVVKEPGESWCFQHHRPRKQCTVQDRHTLTLRCSDELVIQVADVAEVLGITRNAAIEIALREFVQARSLALAPSSARG